MDNFSFIKKNLFLLILALFSLRMQGQFVSRESLFTDEYTLESNKNGTLGLSIDNTCFLQNNEFDSAIQKGYTLPGFRLNPRLIYYPLPIVKLEAGLSLLKYWGANKYPNYAYRDIAEWKAGDYQTGFHLLPFFRAQIQPVPQLNIIMGNLYGGNNHGLIKPLYNPELNFSADPELGAQILYESRLAQVDAWVNWESFIFRNDTHNEAFTAGISACFHVTKPQSFFYLGIPLQTLIIHRGGELDGVLGEILSLANTYTGLRWGFNWNEKRLKSVEMNILGAHYTSVASGKYAVPFSRGWAFYSDLKIRFWNTQLKMAYWRSNDFINSFGNPVFGNISVNHANRNFPHVMVFNPGFSYEQKFGNGVYLGLDFDYFYNPKLTASENSGTPLKTSQSNNYSMGLYLRINPSIILSVNRDKK